MATQLICEIGCDIHIDHSLPFNAYSNSVPCYRAVVRKKAVMALHRFFLLSPNSMDHLQDKIRRVLCDADPSVMNAALHLLHGLAQVKALCSSNSLSCLDSCAER